MSALARSVPYSAWKTFIGAGSSERRLVRIGCNDKCIKDADRPSDVEHDVETNPWIAALETPNRSRVIPARSATCSAVRS